ncbi:MULTISPECIES: hypothetical protein [unclassified Leucobacter]|uniref:hypothetical protein n=1 Tax=unclassified Leucobacter TaxID=2621730 RepID=UPI000B0624D3|nr:hypothetical protein [Leucobacter sp. Ag1]
MDAHGHDELIEKTRVNFNAHGHHWLDLFSEALAKAEIDIRLQHLERQSTFEGTIIRLMLEGEPLDDTFIKVLSSGTSTEFWLTRSTLENEQTSLVLKQAISFASQKAGRSTQHFKWSTILIQVPQVWHHSSRLTSKIQIGELTLEPEELVFTDVLYPGMTFDGTYRIHQSHPIRVRGQTQATSWESALREAERTLRKLCGLLALNWDPPYEVAASIVNRLHGEPSARTTRAGIQLTDSHTEHSVAWEDHPSPKYTDEAWVKLNSSDALKNAVDAYLEARYVEEKHQALALVAYVSSIEAIANILFVRPRDKDVTKAFKAALRVILPEEEAEALGRVYSWRSTTVHQGIIHGGEEKTTHLLTDIFSNDMFSNLRSLLPKLRSAAKMLLVKALLGQLPPRQELANG